MRAKSAAKTGQKLETPYKNFLIKRYVINSALGAVKAGPRRCFCGKDSCHPCDRKDEIHIQKSRAFVIWLPLYNDMLWLFQRRELERI